MTIREQTQEIEKQFLAPKAVLAENTRGRFRQEDECPMRTAFQRDRDRIIHCKAYRRMMNKTQVFLSPEGDHYRTRLTHTQEVNQVARTIARALRLNEDLTEAIALGHDLGHTPFGHAGEAALNNLSPLGFRHSIQSVRVVHRLEKEGQGLNLTWEVLNGIACHSTNGNTSQTLEGQVVRFADKIAYMNHDIEDAIRAKVLQESDIPWDLQYRLGRTNSQRITTFLESIIENSAGKDKIKMSDEMQSLYNNLRDFLFEAVYTNPRAKGEECKVKNIINGLYEYFMMTPKALPLEYQRILREEGLTRAVSDYISGMSDRYAIHLFENLFVPKSWAMM